MSGVLRIGSRGSKLALILCEWVRDRLVRLHPDLRIEIAVIQTKGDRLQDAPLATFTIGFPGAEDETPLARIVSRRYGTDQHEDCVVFLYAADDWDRRECSSLPSE